MKHHELQIKGKKSVRRSGRGISAGRGKTAGRGTKGQNARSGGSVRLGFEGGQTPLIQQMPKLKGFRPRPKNQVTITTGDLSKLSGSTVDAKALAEAGIVKSEFSKVKLIDGPKLTKKYTVKLPSISEGAKINVEKAGGSFTETAATMRPKKTKQKEQ